LDLFDQDIVRLLLALDMAASIIFFWGGALEGQETGRSKMAMGRVLKWVPYIMNRGMPLAKANRFVSSISGSSLFLSPRCLPEIESKVVLAYSDKSTLSTGMA